MEKQYYGIDLMKILTMFMVVVLHVTSYSSGMSPDIFGTPFSNGVWLLNALSYCAVDCFAMTTGFLMVDRRFRYSRVASLWVQVFSYSVGGLVLIFLLSPEVVLKMKTFSVILYFFPVIAIRYWYFTAYFVLALMIPFLNKGLMILEKKEYKALLLTIFLLLSIWTTVWNQDSFHLRFGSSAFWLICMYCFGGYVKRFGVPKFFQNSWFCAGAFLFLCLTTWASKVFLIPLLNSLGSAGESLAATYDQFLYQYSSPTTLLEALILLCVFSSLEIRREAVRKLVRWGARYSFGVYLAHMHVLIKNDYLKPFIYSFTKKYCHAPNQHVLAGLATVVGLSVLVYLLGTLVDLIRAGIFRILKIDERIDRLLQKKTTA